MGIANMTSYRVNNNEGIANKYIRRKTELEGLRMKGFGERNGTELSAGFEKKREGVGIRWDGGETHLGKESESILRKRKEVVGTNNSIVTES